MTDAEVMARLQAVITKASPKPVDWKSVRPETTIASIGFDSLSMLDLIYDIQQGFGVEFDAEQMAGVRTVGDLVRFLASKQSS
jgi:acyl carrier protein